MKLIFMGSPSFAVPSLQALVTAGHDILAVYTQPPRPAGRGNKLTPTAVHTAANEMGFVVKHPEKLKGEALDEVLAFDADVVCVVGYGLLLPKKLVDTRVCINVHPSALPRWRGATPVQSAIMAGDALTEVCIMRLEAGMDTGPVYDRTPVEIDADMTTGELNDIVWPIGAKRLVKVLARLAENPATEPEAQSEQGATHAPKITGEMRPLDFSASAWEVHNKVRGLSPAPAATMQLGDEVIKVLRTAVAEMKSDLVAGTVIRDGEDILVACGDGGMVQLVEVQRPGKLAMAAREALRSVEVSFPWKNQ